MSSQHCFRLGDEVTNSVRLVLKDRGWRDVSRVISKNKKKPPRSRRDCHVELRTYRFKDTEYAAAHATRGSTRLNHFPRTADITQKDKLLRHLRRMQAVYGSAYNFFPQSFILPRERSQYDIAAATLPSGTVWICKPCASSQGRGIYLIDNARDVPMDAPYVVQQYIADPYLIGGYKFDIRLYVLVNSFRPLEIFLYRRGLARFGTQKYEGASIDKLYAHLTNASINKHNRSAFNTDKDVIGAGSKWTLPKLFEHLSSEGVAIDPLWAKIKAIVSLTMMTIIHMVPVNVGCFELFGFDIMLDSKAQPWLLEVNCSPALAISGDVDRATKVFLLNDIMQVIGMADDPPYLSDDEFDDEEEPAEERSAARASSPATMSHRTVPPAGRPTGSVSAAIAAGSAAVKGRVSTLARAGTMSINQGIPPKPSARGGAVVASRGLPPLVRASSNSTSKQPVAPTNNVPSQRRPSLPNAGARKPAQVTRAAEEAKDASDSKCPSVRNVYAAGLFGLIAPSSSRSIDRSSSIAPSLVSAWGSDGLTSPSSSDSDGPVGWLDAGSQSDDSETGEVEFDDDFGNGEEDEDEEVDGGRRLKRGSRVINDGEPEEEEEADSSDDDGTKPKSNGPRVGKYRERALASEQRCGGALVLPGDADAESDDEFGLQPPSSSATILSCHVDGDVRAPYGDFERVFPFNDRTQEAAEALDTGGDSKNTPATVFQDFLKVAVREVRGRFMSVIASPQKKKLKKKVMKKKPAAKPVKPVQREESDGSDDAVDE